MPLVLTMLIATTVCFVFGSLGVIWRVSTMKGMGSLFLKGTGKGAAIVMVYVLVLRSCLTGCLYVAVVGEYRAFGLSNGRRTWSSGIVRSGSTAGAATGDTMALLVKKEAMCMVDKRRRAKRI